MIKTLLPSIDRNEKSSIDFPLTTRSSSNASLGPEPNLFILVQKFAHSLDAHLLLSVFFNQVSLKADPDPMMNTRILALSHFLDDENFCVAFLLKRNPPSTSSVSNVPLLIGIPSLRSNSESPSGSDQQSKGKTASQPLQ